MEASKSRDTFNSSSYPAYLHVSITARLLLPCRTSNENARYRNCPAPFGKPRHERTL